MEGLKLQLAQVEKQLENSRSSSAGNSAQILKLEKMHANLERLISMTASKSSSSASASDTSKPRTDPAVKIVDSKPEETDDKEDAWEVGDVVEAKWSGDSKWYEARVEGKPVNNQVAVIFTQYGSSELVKLDNIRKPPRQKRKDAVAPEVATVPKRKKQTLAEHHEKKAKEQAEKASAWNSFKATTKLPRSIVTHKKQTRK